MIHFFLYEFTRLRAGSLTLALVPPCPLQCLFLWHADLLRRGSATKDNRQQPLIAIAGEPNCASVVSYARADQ
jgi:hypothetical protein